MRIAAGGGGIELADRAASDSPLTFACHKEASVAVFQVLGLEVRSKPLLGRIQLT